MESYTRELIKAIIPSMYVKFAPIFYFLNNRKPTDRDILNVGFSIFRTNEVQVLNLAGINLTTETISASS